MEASPSIGFDCGFARLVGTSTHTTSGNLKSEIQTRALAWFPDFVLCNSPARLLPPKAGWY